MAHGYVVLTNHRPTPPTAEQPRMSLYDWRIVQFDDGRVLVGVLENGFTCRMTTEITSIDLPGREIRTWSGRLYELRGRPASEPDRLMMIAAQVATFGRGESQDVTEEIWTAMCRATA
jgi:hypothetical protein